MTGLTVPSRIRWNPKMSNHPPARAGSLDVSRVRTSSSPIDHALTLLLADETEAALRWGAAALERDPLLPSALVVTSRLLDQMGRMRAAIDGLRLAVRRAIDTGDLPLAVAAIDELRILGADVRDAFDHVAVAFCRGSPRLLGGPSPLAAVEQADFLEPLSPFLAGPPLASRAAQIVLAAKQAHDGAAGVERRAVPALPLFSALTRDALRDLLGAFHVITVPSGQRIFEEGLESDAAYIVVQGEVVLSRRAAAGDKKPPLTLASLGNGEFFGEMALLSRLPSATSATTTRPSILLVGKRDALVAVAARRPEVAIQLAAHCRRNALANLGWSSPIVALVPKEERAAFVERFQMRIFERGEKLMRDHEEAKGLHLLVSGEVAVIGREWSERVLLATLGPGETLGEVELVLCRQSYADAVAVRPTAALFLSREEYAALVQDRPAVLHGLYSAAVRRHAETRLALDAGSAPVADDWLLDEDQTETRLVSDEGTAPTQVVPARSPLAAEKRVSMPPPLPPPVAEQTGVGLPVNGKTSVAPTSASIRPAAGAGPGRLSLTPLHVAAGGALVLSAAGLMAVFIVREGRRTEFEPAMGATTAAAPTAAQAVPPTPTETTVTTTWAPIPVPTPAVSGSSLGRAAAPAAAPGGAPPGDSLTAPPAGAPARARPLVKIDAHSPSLRRPPSPSPAPSREVPAAAASAASRSVPSAAAPAPSVIAGPGAASKAPVPPAASSPKVLSTDEFGGRE